MAETGATEGEDKVVVERAMAAAGRAVASATAAVAVGTVVAAVAVGPVGAVGTVEVEVEVEAAIALEVHWAGLASRMKFHRKLQAAARAWRPNGTAHTAFRPRTRARPPR